MSLEISVVIGIGAAIVLGGGALLAAKIIKKKTQVQSVASKGTGIQSGRDTKIGK
jgi:hypothetical protein